MIMYKQIKICLKSIFLRMKNINKVKFGSKSVVAFNAEFEGCNAIGDNTIFSGKLGYGSYVSSRSVINATVGRYTSIGAEVMTVSGNHPTEVFVSTHPLFYSVKTAVGQTYVDKTLFEEYNYADKCNNRSVIIGNDVWIGSRAIIMEGVTVGDGAVIAAGAIVTKNVEPYSIVMGVPAKAVKYRFDEKQREFLKEFKWWDKPEEWIRKNADKFRNIEMFCDFSENVD